MVRFYCGAGFSDSLHTQTGEEINAVVENFMEQWKAGNAANMT